MGRLFADFQNDQVLFSQSFKEILPVCYVHVEPLVSENLSRLARYLVWKAWLEKPFPASRCGVSAAFTDWMLGVCKENELPGIGVWPPLPRAAVASTVAFPYCGGPTLLTTEQGRLKLLWWFHGNFNTLLSGYAEPQWMVDGFAFQEGKKRDWPLMVEAFWSFFEENQQAYPIRDSIDRIAFLDWCARHPERVFPEGRVPVSVRAVLESPTLSDTGEGLTRGMEARAHHEQCSLDTPEKRQQYVTRQFLVSPENVPQWSWDALCSQVSEQERIPVLAHCLAQMQSSESGDALGLFLKAVAQTAPPRHLPEWLIHELASPASFDDADRWSISVAMLSLARVCGGPLPDTAEKKAQLIAWYAEQTSSLPESVRPSGADLLIWDRKGIQCPSSPFFVSRQQSVCSVLGWPDGGLGVGEDSRTLFASLKTAGVTCNLASVSDIVPYFGSAYPLDQQTGKEPVGLFSIYCLAAQDIYRLRLLSPDSWWTGRYSIGVCPWELPLWPDSMRYCVSCLDEIWAPSHFIADAFSHTGKLVKYVPPAVLPLKPTGTWRERLNLSDATVVFLTSYDSNASYLRKNPFATVRAFNKAFSGTLHDVCLIVKTMNAAAHHEREWKALQKENQCGNRMIFIDEMLTPAENVNLLNTCDAFVSLHRSEGFGRLLAETMLLGKLLVASDFGGSTDYVLPETGCPVPGKLTPVPDGGYLFGEGQSWFDPDEEYAAELFRDILANWKLYTSRVAQGQSFIMKNHTPEVVGKKALTALQQAGFLA